MAARQQSTTILQRIDNRLVRLEDWKVTVEIANARAEEMRKHSDERFDAVEKRLDQIDDTMKWLTRLIGTAIIGAIMAFLFSGALKADAPTHPSPAVQQERPIRTK